MLTHEFVKVVNHSLAVLALLVQIMRVGVNQINIPVRVTIRRDPFAEALNR